MRLCRLRPGEPQPLPAPGPSAAGFCEEGSDLQDAQARHLLFHLQEQGRLESLWTAMRERDPSQEPPGTVALRIAAGEVPETLVAKAWDRALKLREP